jgi:hypothetical protein
MDFPRAYIISGFQMEALVRAGIEWEKLPLWWVPVASYDRQDPIRWAALWLPGPPPQEGQSLILADPWTGDPIGTAQVRLPPICLSRPEKLKLFLLESPIYLAAILS